MSRPTMSAAIAELERIGYVDEIGVVQGTMGRRAVKYRAGRGAGHIIAVDAGATHVRLRLATLDRRLLHSRVHRLPTRQLMLNEEISAAVADEVAAAIAERQDEWGPLRVVGIALPTRVVDKGLDWDATRQNVIFSRFSPPGGVDLVLENNVNCAAVAERFYGAAKDWPTFAYIQIGLKIGMGLMLGGELVRGRNGAAGEIGHLSFPFAPGLLPVAGEAERYMGTEALIARVRADWPADAGAPPLDTRELLSRAEAGEPAALVHVDRHATDVGALIAACVSVVDPGLVVLGGGMGASPLLLPKTREVANRLSYPVEVENSALGSDATVLGIERLAIDRAMSFLLGDDPITP
ncbi:MAG: ROK family protein [Ancalomicrobiaceae bacterium]|nr:ROK family protein [Ancalomicrobiaceae bacterium]